MLLECSASVICRSYLCTAVLGNNGLNTEKNTTTCHHTYRSSLYDFPGVDLIFVISMLTSLSPFVPQPFVTKTRHTRVFRGPSKKLSTWPPSGPTSSPTQPSLYAPSPLSLPQTRRPQPRELSLALARVMAKLEVKRSTT